MPFKYDMHAINSLDDFIQQLDSSYKTQVLQIPLFNPQQTALWDSEQKKHFAAVFYHLRGHFINFIWYIANFCNNSAVKSVLLDNIHEEIGIESRFSHEYLYERFARECHVDIHDEIVNENNYLPFAKAFNKAHLGWLAQHDADQQLAAFAAYERLDNIDYPHLVTMAQSLKLSSQALGFFNVHVHVEHFDSTRDLIQPIWEQSPERLIEAFQFIYDHQYRMWQNLSDTVFELH